MRLAAIYCVWYDGIEILPFSIAAIEDLVDEVIIVYSDTSNYGKIINYTDKIEGLGQLINWEPDLKQSPHQNEIAKRNFALEVAKGLKYTHFVMMDCDECYDPVEFLEARRMMEGNGPDGLVCHLKTYIKEPTLQCNDHTLVPFIHRLNPDTQFVFGNRNYPFAYDMNGNAHIDPTRRLNYTYKHGIRMSDATMHHFSHVRKDIRQKMQNSSARQSLLKSSLLEDYNNAAPGYYSKFYRDELIEVPNQFGIRIF